MLPLFNSIYNTLPFKKMPGRIILDPVNLMIFWLNNLPTSPYVGGDLIPLQIITGLTINYMKH